MVVFEIAGTAGMKDVVGTVGMVDAAGMSSSRSRSPSNSRSRWPNNEKPADWGESCQNEDDDVMDCEVRSTNLPLPSARINLSVSSFEHQVVSQPFECLHRTVLRHPKRFS